MDKRYAIFDMDGTLVDSMSFWRRLGPDYVARRGAGPVSESLLERVRAMTMAESTALLLREYGLPDRPEDAMAEMTAVMAEHYRRDIQLKPGVKEYLQTLHDRGVSMAVASATAEPLVEACLTRLGVRAYFTALVSCESVGVGKSRPDVYHAAAKRLGAAPAETAVYEDAWEAAKTAKDAGYYVVAVFDGTAADRWPALQALADESIAGWETK